MREIAGRLAPAGRGADASAMTTVATCNLLVEAQILQTTLGGSGITAFLPDELTAQTSGNVYAYAIDGIRVQVEDEDADAARAILAALPPA